MIATKERTEFKLVPLAPKDLGADGLPPNEPPPPDEPPSGGGANDWSSLWGILIIIAVILVGIFSANSIMQYFSLVQAAVDSGALTIGVYMLILFATPPITILAFLNARRFDFSPPTYEDFSRIQRRQSFRWYIFGMTIIVCCFHSAVVFGLLGMLTLIEMSALIISLAQIVDQVRLSFFFPQSSRDIEAAFKIVSAAK